MRPTTQRKMAMHNEAFSNQLRMNNNEGLQWESNILKIAEATNTPEFKMVYKKGANAPSNTPKGLKKTKLYIKNMVSIRCKMIVKAVLENLELNHTHVELGHAEIIGDLSEEMRLNLKSALLRFGLELMDDQKNIIIEQIKNIIVEMVHYSDDLPKIKFSEYLKEKLNHDYTYLSSLFSEVKGTTIEHFIIAHKIERVKELLVYNELTLSEIAFKLHYSSVAHLSNQFKKISGLTPSHFKNMKHKRLIALENL